MAEQYAATIERDLDERSAGRAIAYDGLDYQRLVDRGAEDIADYNYVVDI